MKDKAISEELSWVCAIMPEATNRKIVNLCRELNKGIGLPETVFKFPLHISLKKSFRTHRFEKVREDALSLLKQHTPMSCQVSGVTLNKNMIWLNIMPNESLLKFHQALDTLLLSKYGIPIDKFDKVFRPHISLFTSGDRDDILDMYDLLKEENLSLDDVEFHKFVIGSSVHHDTFYEL
jgi:2'-5' RNA ligase